MSQPFDAKSTLESLLGNQVVVDVKAPYVYIGILHTVGADALVLADADVHPCEDSQSTREFYVLETKKNGIRANRRMVHVMRTEIVSVSRLTDVVDY